MDIVTFINDLKRVANVISSEILGPENVALVTIDTGHRLDTFHVTPIGDKVEMDLVDEDGEITSTVEMSSGREFDINAFKTRNPTRESAMKVVDKVLAEDHDDEDEDVMDEFSDDCVDNVDEISTRKRYIQHMTDILLDRVVDKLKVSPEDAKRKISDLAMDVWDLYHGR